MGESRIHALRVDFNSSLRLEFHGSTITSDAGLLAYRELDSALGLTKMAETCLLDVRHGKNTELNYGSRYSAGWRDTKTRTTPTGSPLILRCDSVSAVGLSIALRHRQPRWEDSRPRCSPSPTTVQP